MPSLLFYDRIGEEVSEAEKVQRVLRQMHPQLQDLAEGHAYNDLAELVKAADGLMERAWRRLQYRPPPLPSNQDRCRGRSPRVEQCVCSAIAVVDSATYLVTVPRVDEWGHPFASGASDRVTCKHSARETSGGRCCPGGHLRQCAPSSDHSRWQRAPYGRPYRVVDVQGLARYRLKCKLLRTARAAAAQASGAKPKADVRVLRLASGWSQSTMSLKCQIEWAAGCRRQQFLCVPDLCRDVVLGRDFLTVSGISLHVSLGGWTVGTEPQRIVPFVKAVKEQPEAVDDFGDSLRCIFAESDATVCASVPEATAACNVIISGHSSDLDPRMKHILEEFSEIFTTTPGCTTLAEHRIDTGDNPPVRCKLRPVNSKKQAIMDNCIQDLLAQNLIRPSQSQHASAPVLVEKKSGGYRMAVDYRQLNARTKVPVYPMPRTDWLLAQLGRA
ncbi:hypothetical protein MRX96_048860, partial [Rhipicephalus microplus]